MKKLNLSLLEKLLEMREDFFGKTFTYSGIEAIISIERI